MTNGQVSRTNAISMTMARGLVQKAKESYGKLRKAKES